METTRRLVESVLPVFAVNSYGFQGRCSYSGTNDCSDGGGAVATLVTKTRRGRTVYKALCNHHAEKHRKGPS